MNKKTSIEDRARLALQARAAQATRSQRAVAIVRKAYTLAEIRNGTGWPKGARFELVESDGKPLDSPRKAVDTDIYPSSGMYVDSAVCARLLATHGSVLCEECGGKLRADDRQSVEGHYPDCGHGVFYTKVSRVPGNRLMRVNLTELANEIEAAIQNGTISSLPQFANVDPESKLNVAKATVAAYREAIRRQTKDAKGYDPYNHRG